MFREHILEKGFVVLNALYKTSNKKHETTNALLTTRSQMSVLVHHHQPSLRITLDDALEAICGRTVAPQNLEMP